MTGPLFDAASGADALDGLLDAQAWLTALCDVEAALARAQQTVGLLDPAAARAVVAACERSASELDAGAVGRAAVAGGNPVIPLVAALRERAGDHAGAVHAGATSQDVLDTATMILTGRCLDVIIGDLNVTGDVLADLAGRTRAQPMIGRTLLQQARPTTFGALVAGWGTGLDRASAGLRTARAGLPAQLGGPVGTLAAWHPQGPQLLAAFAAETGLAEPDGVWHSDRTVVAQLAGSLGVVGSAVAKIAVDLVLLAQTELGEVREAAPGGSSSMPHKQNPVAAITARAAAMQVPGLVATLLSAASPELQRGAGPWHAEWPALSRLLVSTAAATSRLGTAVTGLHVDTSHLDANAADGADATDGATGADGAGHAGDLVDRWLARRETRQEWSP